MAINPLYIPLFNIEEVILDKDTGLPLAAGVVSFYRDAQRLTPKVVYQIAGVSPNYTFVSVGSQLTLGLSGTFVDQDGDPFVPYAYPYDNEGELDLYYVTVESSGGVPQFVRQAVPYVDTGGISPSERTDTENEMSNPQFVEVNFNSSAIATISVTGSDTVTPIAPDWDVITTGTGTLTLERLQPVSAGVVTNPPFALRIEASAGLGSTIQLRQRFLNTPSIFRGGFVSGSITAAVLSGGGSFISMSYIPSTGTPTQIIPSTSIPTDGAYHIIANNAAITDQANSPASTGYTDISIILPTARNIAITSIQVVGTAISVNIPFDEQTAARQRDHLAHYYKPQLAYKQIPSFLTAWDFPLNPAQILGTSIGAQAIGANKSFYAWDQTIVFQSINSGVAIAADVNGNIILGATTPTQMAVIQYLDQFTARDMLHERLAVNLCAVAATATIPLTISLWYTTDVSLPNVATGTNNSLVLTLDANGKPATFNGNWTEIKRDIKQDATANVTTGANLSDFSFNGWSITPAIANTVTFFAIVIGTASVTTSNQLIINSVGLCAGDIATRPAPQTLDEVLRECEYYYEKSYDFNVLPGAVTNAGARTVSLSTSVDSSGLVYNMYAQTFGVVFNQVKRVIPALTFYSPTGTANAIQIGMVSGNNYLSPDNTPKVNPNTDAISGYVFTGQSPKSFLIAPNGLRQLFTFTAASFGGLPFTLQSLIFYHYIADARLGII
jgi:hypothetical protein